MHPFIYILPSGFSLKKLCRNLPASTPYTVSFEKGEKEEGVLFDTFSGDVSSANSLLLQLGNALILTDLSAGLLVEQTMNGEWSLAADLEDGPVSSSLHTISRLRAFLPIASGNVRYERGLLMDDEGKTRARFYNLILGFNGSTLGIGSTCSLRGYDKAHADLCLSLERMGAVACNGPRHIFELLGMELPEYSAKPQLQLDPAAPAKVCATNIIRSFVQVARRNEDGVIDDHDTEFLHDYRVSLRKVRSVLSLFKGVYGEEETRRLKKEFSHLMQRTNALRDLDVYLLDRPRYYKLVPEDAHHGLDILFDYIGRLRRQEQKKVRKTLRQPGYRKQMEALEKIFADDANLSSGPQAAVHSLDYACRLIDKRYRQVCTIARTIDDKTDDSVIHKLRINCKKLRYLMEFFSPLFSADEIKALVKSLKVLQDNLGRFNDYSVQQIFLRKLLTDKISEFEGDQLQVAESIGALTAMLHRLQIKERGSIMKNFTRFDSSEIGNAFARNFQIKERAR